MSHHADAHAVRAHDVRAHSHGLVDPSITRSREGLRVVAVSLAILTVTALIQAAIYVATDSVALLADLIPAVHATHPDLAFIAEVDWGMESTLHEQGFQLCYDKGLHDRLANGTAASIRAHLESDAPHQERLVRFIENHDEARAASSFPPGRARAAAVTMSTLEGARRITTARSRVCERACRCS